MVIKKTITVIGLLLLQLQGFAVIITRPSSDPVRPKLVVGIVVDQMRWDYLYRYQHRYQRGGFKRLLREGFTCENTHINYIPTVTAAGHASVYTGSVPAIHGIAGNDFVVQATGKTMYCTEDTSVHGLGVDLATGQMSPRNLLSTTITDELKLATNFRSKVIGIALKDRGAILPAGHSADAAYWFEDSVGEWISSSFYMNALPDWVKKFNSKRSHERYLKNDWHTLYPIATYQQSEADYNTHEGVFKGMEAPVFPIPTSLMMQSNKGLIRSTPFGNSFTLDFAKATITSEQMGEHEDTDFLTLSLSSTDYIGHQFGANAIETEDTYLRLDADLASFFSFLDHQVGRGEYTVFLTADHGAAHNVAFLKDHRIPSGLFDTGKIQQKLNASLLAKYQQAKLVLGFHNFQLNLNMPAIKAANINLNQLKEDCISFLSAEEGIAYVLDMKNVQQENIPLDLKQRIANGYNLQRSGSIQLVLLPGWYFGSSLTGTTHGTGYTYDTKIPLLFMGWGVKHGQLYSNTSMSDIAVTLAAILNIQPPSGAIGLPIKELIKKPNLKQ